MSARQTAERARTRYAHALYRTALLRDPHPGRAADAVVAAFSSIDWANTALDDQLEARLVAALPPLPRRWSFRRANLPQPLSTLPATFWHLSPPTRVALGLRLLRGMATPLIADTLQRPLAEVQTLLLDGVTQIGGLATSPLDEECRRFRTLRLDDPQAERGHGLCCIACQSAAEAWDRPEALLSAQLAAALAPLPLPPQVDVALSAAFEQGEQRQAGSSWRHPWRWRLALVAVVLVALGSLIWPRQANQRLGTLARNEPRAVLEQARAVYLGVPEGEGVVHRSWEIGVRQLSWKLQADEWVDTAQPARHRLQLLDNTTVKEWQMGDGQVQLQYQSAFPTMFCGPSPTIRNTASIHTWSMAPNEQAQLRATRWQAGTWALGLYYLEQAGRADSLRSLGIGGSGAEANLTLLAEGKTIDGTLLLRFDPRTHELREVRELRTENGQTSTYVPWRLMLRETVDTETARKQSLLDRYPGTPPTVVKHDGPVIDHACPLTSLVQPLSLPRVLASNHLLGLPALVGDLSRALLVGHPGARQPDGYVSYDPNELRLVYLGPGKRLVLANQRWTSTESSTKLRAGPWIVELDDQLPGRIIANLRAVGTDEGGSSGNSYGEWSAWTQGWQREELLQVLATVRPLGLDDWARAPDLYLEPEPFDAATHERLIRFIQATARRPGKTLHQVEVNTVRRAPFLDALTDPYHRVPPLQTHTERWIAVNERGNVERLQSVTSAPSGDILNAIWNDKEASYSFNGPRNTVITDTLQSYDWLLPAAETAEMIRRPWQWQSLPDGGWVAEYSRPLHESSLQWLFESQVTGQGEYFGPWLLDPTPDTIVYRREWGPDGLPRRSETFGLVSNQHEENSERPTTSTLVLERTEWETLTWLPAAPISAWDFEPPVDAEWARVDPHWSYRETAMNIVRSAAEAAAEVPFPIWEWGDGISGLKFRSSRVPTRINSPLHPYYPQTFKDAVQLGVALELNYGTPEGSLRLTQGPAPKLRRLLQQTMPLWRSSERRTLQIEGRTHDLWVMQGDKADRHWAVIEREQTLVFMEHKGPAAEWESMLKEVGQMRPVVVD